MKSKRTKAREITYRILYRGRYYGSRTGASQEDAIANWLAAYPDHEREKFDRGAIEAERVRGR